jgi:hypothetical protein
VVKTTLVDRQIREGRRLAQALRAKGFDVQSAAWIKSVESQEWRLHISSTSISQMGYREAYRLVDETLNELKPRQLDLFDIRLMEVSNAVAKSVAAWQATSNASDDTVYSGYELGDLPIEEAFIYAPAATTQI